MDRSGRPIKASFILVQPEEVARTWTDPKLIRVLAKFLKIWAGTVHGEVDHLDITVAGKPGVSTIAIEPKA